MSDSADGSELMQLRRAIDDLLGARLLGPLSEREDEHLRELLEREVQLLEHVRA